MGATEVDVALGDGGHAELVEGSGEERGEGAGKHHATVSNRTTDRHAHLQERRQNKRRNVKRAGVLLTTGLHESF